MPYVFTGVNNATGAEGETIFSALSEIKKPDVRQKLMLLEGAQEMPFIEHVRSLYGESQGIGRSSTRVFEDTDKRRAIVVASTSAVPVAAPWTMTITLNTAASSPQLSYIPWTLYNSYLQYNQNSPYVAGQYGIPTQLNDMVLFPENQAAAQVVAIANPNTATVVLTVQFPGGANNVITVAPAAGTVLPVYGGGWSEGSGQPKGKVNLIGYDDHYLQIVKESAYITGTQDTDQLWFNSDSSGSPITGIRKLVTDISEYDFYKTMSLGMLFGPGGGTQGGKTFYLDPTTSKEPNTMTEGLVNYIKRRGTDMTVAPGALSLATFATDTAIAIQRYGAGMRLIYAGNLRGAEINDVMRQANAGTWIRYASEDKEVMDKLYKNDTNLAFNLNYSSFMINNRVKYCIASIPEFDVLDQYNDALQWAAMIMPHGINQQSRRDMQQNPLPYLQLIHKELNGYSRFMEMWQANRGEGGQPAKYNSQIDAQSFDYRSEYGCVHNGGLRMTWLHK